MTWINSLKIAIIEENTENISKILKELPKFQNVDKAKEALSLIQAATTIAKKRRGEILETMRKIKKTKEFLNY